MGVEYVETKAAGEIIPKQGTNSRLPYSHQREAIKAMDELNKKFSAYSTLIVLPTGGGKTYTASTWLLRNALDKGKKILWLAHRQTLLEQAAESFQKFAFSSEVPNISSFRYRIISGANSHERTSDIKTSDNLLIISKDSIGRNLNRLDSWLAGENEIFLVVDEAHHSTAKTYRKVIDYVRERVKNLKLIGLTATPFRTAESEQGLLAKIYTDGTRDGQSVKNDVGIVYQVGLKELISRRILSTPKFESYYTDEDYGKNLGLKAWENIQHLDKLPDDVAQEIAESGARNKLIVETYKKKAAEYGQTIVFTVSINHAIILTKLFNQAGIKAAYIVSNVKDFGTGVSISREDNEKNLELYRAGKIQILVNVNILTEGVDLPMTKTVFLTRPTVSTILMTQMVGRALRGEAANGTATAYIVSFVDNWNERIAWVNPETLFTGTNDFDENDPEYQKKTIRLISIAKIEEFAAILNDNIETDELEAVPFLQRIPIGMYAFQYINEDGIDFSYQVMVYDSTKNAYEKFMQELPNLSKYLDSDEEYLPQEILDKLVEECEEKFFNFKMVPPYDERDVRHILKYFAQKGECPNFYTFDYIDRNKLDVAKIAQKMWDENMPPREQNNYLNELWENGDDNILRLFFGKRIYFTRMVSGELFKLANAEEFPEKPTQINYGKKFLKELSLSEIEKHNPELAKKLREETFQKAKVEGGYKCACCGKIFTDRRFLQIDHIKPLNNGGLTVPENLQVLCRSCNAKKSDKENFSSDTTTTTGGGNIYIKTVAKSIAKDAAVEEIIKAVAKDSKMADDIKRQFANAEVDGDGKFTVYIDYIDGEKHEKHPTWHDVYYVVNKDYTLTRFGLDVAQYLTENHKYNETAKKEIEEMKTFSKDEKFFKDALKNSDGKYIVKNYFAADGCENHYLVLKNYKVHRLFNYTAEKLYRENQAVKISQEEFENMKK